MAKNLRKILIGLLFFGILVSIPSIDGQAKTLVKSGKIKLNSVYYDEGNQTTIPVTIKKKMLLIISLDIKILDEDCCGGGIRVQLRDKKGSLIQNDYQSLKGWNKSEEFNYWFYTDSIYVPAGKYEYTLINKSDSDVRIKYKIIGYNKVSSSIKSIKTIKIRSGEGKNIKLSPKPAGSFPLTKNISCTKGLLANWWQDADGSLYVEGGKKPKEGTLTVTLQNGKKYKIKVKVMPAYPDFMAYLDDYYTRDNYFTARIKNYGTSNLTIIRQGKVVNVDYKSFDRRLKSMKSVTIKPGQTKTVKFYLKGSTTWYDVADYTLYAKVKYQGKTYDWHVWDEDSVYKVGKKWYATYSDDE